MRIDVLIALILLRRASAVDHIPKMAIANVVILMPIREMVFGKFEDQSDENEQFLHNVLGNLTLEALDLFPVLVDNLGVCPLQLRD